MNTESRVETIKIIKHWAKIDVWIIIQSKWRLQKEKKNKKKKMLEEQEEEKLKINKMSDFEFKENLETIDSKFIIAKYKNLEVFNNRNKNDQLCKNAENKIIEQYQNGDEIWHYDELAVEFVAGSFKELFLLIRNGSIVCSPIIKSGIKCIF